MDRITKEGNAASFPGGRADLHLLSDIVSALYAYAGDPHNWEDLMRFTHLVDQGRGGLQDALSAEILRHIAQARTLTESQTRQAVLESMQSSMAWLLFGERGRVLGFNEAMAAHLAPLTEGLSREKRISWLSRENGQAFEALARQLDRDEAQGPFLLRLEPQEGGLPLFGFLAGATHGRRFAEPHGEGEVRSVLFMPARALSFDETVLPGETLGLSPAEARLAGLLTEGLALKEAAQALGISPNTARNQLARIFEKLGLNRQGDLIRHLAELMALGSMAGVTLAGSNSSVDMAGFRQPARSFVSLPDGRRLSYRDYGDPKGEVILNFSPVLTGSFLRAKDALWLEESGIRNIRLERPGSGGSAPDPLMTPQSVARDVRYLLDTLGIERVIVYGSSSGSPFAVAAAIELGERVIRIGLNSARIEAHYDRDFSDNPVLHFFASLIRNAWLRRSTLQLLQYKFSRHVLRGMMLRFFQTSPADMARLEADPEVADALLDTMLDTLPHQVHGLAREFELAEGGYQLDPAKIQVPLHVWHGSEDTQSRLEDVRADLERFPVTSFHILEGQGHLCGLTHVTHIYERLCRGSGPGR